MRGESRKVVDDKLEVGTRCSVGLVQREDSGGITLGEQAYITYTVLKTWFDDQQVLILKHSEKLFGRSQPCGI